MLLEVGHIARAHGLRGEVVVELVTNQTSRLDPASVLSTDVGPLEVVSSRRHGGEARWVVSFVGVDDRPAAEGLRGQSLRAEALLGADHGDTLWVHEMIGAIVIDADGLERGTVTDLQANPASDLLVLDSGALVPLRFVVDHSPGVLRVDVPEGLFEL